MAGAPQLILVGGPNGSGKSTLIAGLRAAADMQLPAQYINADDIQRERGLVDARDAQQIATALRAEAVQQRRDLMFETVMSHPSKIAELQRAKACIVSPTFARAVGDAFRDHLKQCCKAYKALQNAKRQYRIGRLL